MTTKEKIAELLPDVQEPYQLHDVLRAIGKKDDYTLGKVILRQDDHFDIQCLSRDVERELIWLSWNLLENWDNQLPELKAFVGSLIGVTN